MRYLPFCPEHGIRIHENTFVYYNGPSQADRVTAIRRNLLFHGDYYVRNVLGASGKIESHRLCDENSEDAVTFNVFAALLSDKHALQKLARCITHAEPKTAAELYLWGGRIDLEKGLFDHPYPPLKEVRQRLEPDIAPFQTEPDVMLVIPGEALICVEAKFGSSNPSTKEVQEAPGQKPKSVHRLIERYCHKNSRVDCQRIFDFGNLPETFPEQLFRNIVFAASMAAFAEIPSWHVVNLGSQHVLNLTRGQPKGRPVARCMRAMLQDPNRRRFSHWTWEQLFKTVVDGNPNLHKLAWYMKNKTLNCRRAFNIL
jgi:hypothetical protein